MPDTLLPTKLFIPLLEPDILTRTHLLAQLTEGRSARLILVSAPAGSGKTTLIADWVHHSALPTGWLSLDAGDDDPWAFLGCLAEAYNALEPGVADRARAMLGTTPSPDPMAIARALIADITAAKLDGIVVLDDYHVLSSPTVHALLTLLIERVLAPATLVVITRSDPPLPLPRLRVRRQLCEIRKADLRFQPAEVAEFLHRFSGRELRAESVEKLASRTEGWAAGLQLAGLALRQATDPDHFIADFQGTHAFIADYLTDEVLASLPAAQQRFVIRSSLLERISGSLCDAALEISGSQALLEELARANLFLVPLDDERRWFRYHHLFADLLRRRAQEQEFGGRQKLLARAAAWCAANGAIGDAVTYASRSGDAAFAAELVARHGVRALAAGEAHRALRWIHRLPEEISHSSPDLCVIAAWAYSQQENYSAAADLARRALDLAADGDDRPHPHVDGVKLHARLVVAGAESLQGGSLEAGLHAVAAVRDEVPTDNLPLRASAEIMHGKLLTLSGQYEPALESFFRARELGSRADADLLRLAGVTGVAETLLMQGRLSAAIEEVEKELAGRSSLSEILGSQVANLLAIQAFAHLERSEDERAAAALQGCRAALGDNGTTDDWLLAERFGRVLHTAFHSSAAAVFFGLDVHFRLLLRRGAHRPAGRLLDMLERSVPTGSGSTERVLVDALRVQYLIAEGDRKRLSRIYLPEAAVSTGSVFWDDVRRLSAARAAVAAADAMTAYSQTRSLLERGTGTNIRHGFADALVLHAMAASAIGAREEAARSAAAALKLTAPERRLAIWLNAGSPAVPLLEEVLVHTHFSDAVIAHATRLLALLRDRTSAGAEPGAHLLSEREVTVLRLLAAGHTNREIGKVLFLAIGTVKKHTHNLYAKLGVSNRIHAVQAGHKQGLLPDVLPSDTE